jgi:hypothetical protein
MPTPDGPAPATPRKPGRASTTTSRITALGGHRSNHSARPHAADRQQGEADEE